MNKLYRLTVIIYKVLNIIKLFYQYFHFKSLQRNYGHISLYNLFTIYFINNQYRIRHNNINISNRFLVYWICHFIVLNIIMYRHLFTFKIQLFIVSTYDKFYWYTFHCFNEHNRADSYNINSKRTKEYFKFIKSLKIIITKTFRSHSI